MNPKNGQGRPEGHWDRWRLWTVYAIIGLIFGVYSLRLFELQIAQGADYHDQADENRRTEVNIQTQRGIIYDRNGIILAQNVPSYNVYIIPAELPGDPTAFGDSTALATELDPNVQEVYRRLSELIDMPVSNGEINEETVRVFSPCKTDLGIVQVVFIADTNAPYAPVNIKCGIDEETAMTIRAMAADLPGVGIEVESVRDYPTGSLTATVIGFLGSIPASLEDYYVSKGFLAGRDKIGYAGIEATQQDILGGKNGLRVVEVDVSGKELRNLETPIDSVPGNNISLTIDTRLQGIAEQALVGMINFWNTYLNEERTRNGVVIAMNPKTGEILAMVSIPTYENDRMTSIIPYDYYQQLQEDPFRPLFNHAISAEHPPGSVYKLPTAVGALNEGVVTIDQILTDPGKITVIQKGLVNDPGRPIDYVCYEEAGHGDVDWLRGLMYSCDVYFYKIGGGFAGEVETGLNIWRLGEYSRALGYGMRSGIELPGEEDGLIPDPNWKRVNLGETWTTGDTYIASMGQGYILSTPLQVLLSASILSNNGVYMQPTLIREVYNAEGEVIRPFEPRLKWDVTKDPLISVYDENNLLTGEKKTIDPWVIEMAKEGMRLVVTDGTAQEPFATMTIPSAGKTGTAEYCDDKAQAKNLCARGSWPTHAWYFGYAPYDDPEIAVVAFVYNGGEGSSVAGPIVRTVMEGYFELKAIDAARGQ